MTTKITGIAPQFLVDDLAAATAYYCDQLGFTLGFCYESFYASVSRDGCAIHLKGASKTLADRAHRQQHEHLDAHITMVGATRLYDLPHFIIMTSWLLVGHAVSAGVDLPKKAL